MKLKFETFYRAFIFVLVVALVWSVWSSVAQAAGQGASTNAPGEQSSQASSNSEPPPTPKWIKKLSEEHAPFLTQVWLGNEVWKYLFSLVYIFLAFYVSKL